MRERSLTAQIDEHNRIQPPGRIGPGGVWVVAAIRGRFNGPDHKAQDVEPGSIVEVAGGPYADDLIATGVATRYLLEAAPDPAHEAAKAKRGRKSRAVETKIDAP